MGFGLTLRKWLTKHVWKKSDCGQKMYYVNQSVEKSEMFPVIKNDSSLVVAKTTGYICLTPGKEEEGTSVLTYIIQFNVGGFLPPAIIEYFPVAFLKDYIAMRLHFAKDYEYDLGSRKKLVEMIERKRNIELAYDEQAFTLRGRSLFKSFSKIEATHNLVKIETKNEFIVVQGERASLVE